MSKGPPAHIRRAEMRRLYDDRHKGLSRDDLDGMIDEAFGRDPSAVSDWSALKLGQVMQMTFEEQQRLGIRTIAPYDRTVEEMKAFSRERKNERDRNWARERRRGRKERRPEMKRIDARTEVIGNLLKQQAEQAPDHWSTVEEIVEAVKGMESFAGITGGSINRVIRRTIDKLIENGAVEHTESYAKRLPVRLVRAPKS